VRTAARWTLTPIVYAVEYTVVFFPLCSMVMMMLIVLVRLRKSRH
jgi:hypothetical protein